MVDHADVACNLPKRAHELIEEADHIEFSCHTSLI